MHAESIKNISGLTGAPQNFAGGSDKPGERNKMTDYEKEKTEEKYWWISLLPSIASIIISAIVILSQLGVL